MASKGVIFIWINVLIVGANVPTSKFPKYFKFGVATSSIQIEGGWNASGKTENMWDYYTHTFPNLVKDGSNADIACDSYNQMDVDIENLKMLNVNFYRFSLNWPRILPKAGDTLINPDGVRYYNELINKLLVHDIEPIITLYHWELPQTIQNLGGWTNPIVVDYFEQFARVAYKLFGDRVKTWVTINEPFSICGYSYEQSLMAPFITSKGVGSYLCGRNLLLAHATAYHVYYNEFKEKQGGEVGITMEVPWFEPKTSNLGDVIAASRASDFHFNWFAHPIFSLQGDYPAAMKQRVCDYSRQQGYQKSRLPEFSQAEINFIIGTSDFLGVNHYNTYLVTQMEEQRPENDPSMFNDVGVIQSFDPSWNKTAREIFTVNPCGLRSVLNYLKTSYRNPKVYIFENGYAGAENETVDDDPRVWYYQGYLKAVLDAVRLDGCDVRAYTAWSFMDNFEWADGYTMRFGLFYVDFNDPKRKRTPKKSAYYYKHVIKSGQV